MRRDIIKRLKTKKDAKLFERTFLRCRKTHETCGQAATRLYCEGRDEEAIDYELLDEKFPDLYAG